MCSELPPDPDVLEGMKASVKVLMDQLDNGYFIYGQLCDILYIPFL